MSTESINCHDCGIQTSRFISESRATGGDHWSTSYRDFYVCADRLSCKERVQAKEAAEPVFADCRLCGEVLSGRRDQIVRLQHDHALTHTVADVIARHGISPFFTGHWSKR